LLDELSHVVVFSLKFLQLLLVRVVLIYEHSDLLLVVVDLGDLHVELLSQGRNFSRTFLALLIPKRIKFVLQVDALLFVAVDLGDIYVNLLLVIVDLGHVDVDLLLVVGDFGAGAC
jgi:hypothetical protein